MNILADLRFNNNINNERYFHIIKFSLAKKIRTNVKYSTKLIEKPLVLLQNNLFGTNK